MEIQSNPYFVWQLLSTLLTLGILVYTQTRPRKKRESGPLALMMLGGTIWSLANIIQWLSPDFAWQMRWNTIIYIGILMVPTAWLLFAVRFTGIGINIVEKLNPTLWIVPALTFIAVVTNDFHHLFYTSQGIEIIDGFAILGVEYQLIFYIHTGYSYLLLIFGMAILGYSIVSNLSQFGVSSYGLIIGVLTPLIGNIYFLFGPIPEGFPDPTPFLFGITGIAFAWSLFRGRLLEVVGIARDSIIQNLSNGIVVLDLNENILDANPAAINILGISIQEPVGWPFFKLLEEGHQMRDLFVEGLERIKSGEPKHISQLVDDQVSYELVFTQIQDNLGLIKGCLLEFWDISEQIQAEKSLASTMDAFESTIDKIPDSYFEADPTGKIIYANNAFVNSLGFDEKQDVIGKHFRNFTDRKAVREIFEKFALLYETKVPLDSFEYHYRTRDGTLYIGETMVSPIMDEDEVVGARGIIRNITDRVNAEREIAAQKDFLDGILQYAPFAIVINDMNKEITVTNPAFQRLFGYSPDEVVGICLNDLVSTPDVVEENGLLFETNDGEEVYYTGKRKKKDGTLIDVDIVSVPFFVNEEKFGNLVFYQDISEKQKAETELAKTQITITEILDSIEDPYFEADRVGTITYSNSAFVKATGYPSKEDVIGKHFRHFTERKSVREIAENFRRVYDTGKPVEPFDYNYRRRDGTTILTAEVVVSPMFVGEEVVGTRGIIRDISVRIKAEEMLRQAKEAAEYRAGELSAINRVAQKVGQSLDLQEILDIVCHELTTIFPVRNAGIGLNTPDNEAMEIVAFHSNEPNEESVTGITIPIEGNSYTEEVLAKKKTVVIQDAQTDPRTASSHELYKERGTKAIMIVPLLARGQAIGTIGMPAKDPDHQFSEEEIELAETIASQIASAVDNARLYAQTETALGAAESDLEIGSQIQSGFFPFTIPTLPGWEIATHFHSARQVAGDFFDIYQFDQSDLTAFVIADVCDKGVGAALFMVLFRSLLRAFSDLEIDRDNVEDRLLEIIQHTNNYIARIHGQSNMFATIFFGILDPESGMLHYINGGHEPPMIMNDDGEIVSRLMPTGPAVGLLPDLPFEVENIQLDCGDILVGFTDGATDARNKTGDLFTEDRLIETIGAPWTSVFSMIFELEAELQNHIGGQDQYDDITLISFRRKSAEGVDYHAICRPAKIAMLGELRDFVEAAASHSGLQDQDVFAFKLSAEEILTNIIQYGYQDREPGMIALSFERDQSNVTMKIWDDGLHFPLDQVESPDIEAGWEERKLGGLGIYFVKELMDSVSYMREGDKANLLMLEKKLDN